MRRPHAAGRILHAKQLLRRQIQLLRRQQVDVRRGLSVRHHLRAGYRVKRVFHADHAQVFAGSHFGRSRRKRNAHAHPLQIADHRQKARLRLHAVFVDIILHDLPPKRPYRVIVKRRTDFAFKQRFGHIRRHRANHQRVPVLHRIAYPTGRLHPEAPVELLCVQQRPV